MTQYKYVTVLEAGSDGKPPNDGIEEGDKIVKAGKHESDSIQYITEDNDIHVVTFHQVEVYEGDGRMTQREAEELAKDRWFSDE